MVCQGRSWRARESSDAPIGNARQTLSERCVWRSLWLLSHTMSCYWERSDASGPDAARFIFTVRPLETNKELPSRSVRSDSNAIRLIDALTSSSEPAGTKRVKDQPPRARKAGITSEQSLWNTPRGLGGHLCPYPRRRIPYPEGDWRSLPCSRYNRRG